MTKQKRKPDKVLRRRYAFRSALPLQTHSVVAVFVFFILMTKLRKDFVHEGLVLQGDKALIFALSPEQKFDDFVLFIFRFGFRLLEKAVPLPAVVDGADVEILFDVSFVVFEFDDVLFVLFRLRFRPVRIDEILLFIRHCPLPPPMRRLRFFAVFFCGRDSFREYRTPR